MDIRMPNVDGLDATRRIAGDADLAHVHVLILTTFDHDEYVIDALDAGAGGFLIKNTDPGQAMSKLGARDRAQLVALAYRYRLVDPPGPASPRAP